MVGLRQRRTSSIARAWAESIITQAQARCDGRVAHRFSVARHEVALLFSRDDEISDLIAGAFELESPHRDNLATTVYAVRLSGDGIAFPDFEWAREWIDACVPIPSSVTAPYRVFFDKNQGVIYCYDESTRRAVVVLRNPFEMDSRSFITPFRLLWSWVGQSKEISILHAGVTEFDGQGVLVAGPSGSGKSTLTFGVALGSRGHFVADDCVAVDQGRAYALFSRVKLGFIGARQVLGSTVHRVPENLPESHHAKAFVQITGTETWFRRETNLAALVFPVIAGKTGAYRLESQQAQRMLIEDSQRELFGGSPRDTIRLAKLAGSLPAYRLLLGTDTDANLRELEALVGR